jgi:hypothetical protein
MANLTLRNGRSLQDLTIFRLRPGQEAAALQAASKDGADNVFFQAGRDTFVASGRGLDLSRLRAGDPIAAGDTTGKVIALDDEVNSASDGVNRVAEKVTSRIKAASMGGAVLGTGLVAAASAPELSVTTGVFMAWGGAAMGGIAIGVAAGAVGAVVTGVAAAKGAFNHADMQAMKPFAD